MAAGLEDAKVAEVADLVEVLVEVMIGFVMEVVEDARKGVDDAIEAVGDDSLSRTSGSFKRSILEEEVV